MDDKLYAQFSITYQEEKLARKKRVGEWIKNSLLPLQSSNDRQSLNLEIGCGHGHWLSSFASEVQDEIFVGIDLINKRIRKAVSKCEKRKQKNILFYKAEACEFLEFCDLSLSNTFVMYPDPWPKSRHHKRRLIQRSFLTLLAAKTEPSGVLYFMTDYFPYIEWSKQIIIESKLWELTSLPWPHNATSYFSELLPENNFLCAKRL